MRLLKFVFVLVCTFTFAAATSAVSLQATELIPREWRQVLEKRNFHESTTHSNSSNDTKVSVRGKNLTPPDKELKLIRVALGVGVQNYTCTNATTLELLEVPAPIGATATLYDVSCFAENHPDLLHALPDALVQVSENVVYAAATIAQYLFRPLTVIIGDHYFRDACTQMFDFSKTTIDRESGKGKIFFGKLEEKVPAPQLASKGQKEPTGMEANGAVDWLRLSTKEGTVGYKAAYRIVTAGGKPPANCTSYPDGEIFEVPYVAEYWFYK
ncbi:hypothetical protein BDZ91DRAFT_843668 [Kalaharituber pfeilii]|nr:hypothetical protein BDZ91DRAFT_843668 [Kalaharituber pfeilii]